MASAVASKIRIQMRAVQTLQNMFQVTRLSCMAWPPKSCTTEHEKNMHSSTFAMLQNMMSRVVSAAFVKLFTYAHHLDCTCTCSRTTTNRKNIFQNTTNIYSSTTYHADNTNNMCELDIGCVLEYVLSICGCSTACTCTI